MVHLHSRRLSVVFVFIVAMVQWYSASVARADSLIFSASTDINNVTNYSWFSTDNWYALDAEGHLVHVGRLPTPDETATVISRCLVPGSVQIANLILSFSGSKADIEGGNFVVDNLTLSGHSDASSGYVILGATTILVRNQMTTVGDQNTLEGTTLTIGPGAAARVDTDPANVHAGGRLKLAGGTLISNQGAFILPDNGALFGEGGNLGCRFDNRPGATVNSSGAASFTWINGGFTFDNSGSVRASSGTLTFDSGVVWTSSSGTGTLQALASDATIVISGLTIGAGTTYGFSGPGTTHLKDTARVLGNLNIGVQDATSGSFVPGHVTSDAQVEGAGIWHVVMLPTAPATNPSTLTLTGDRNSGRRAIFVKPFKPTVNIDAPAQLILNGDEVKSLNGTFNNAGLTKWIGAGGLDSDGGVIFNNLAGGVFDAQNDAGFSSSFDLPATFNNAGTFRKSAGTGQTGIGPNFNNTGTVDLRTGTTFFNNYTQTNGVIGLNGGNLDASNNPLVLKGGTLSGAGTITGSVSNGGTISPGHSPGLLTISRDYTQTASGVLIAQIAGRTPVTQYDQLVVGGTATMAGVLNVQLQPGFVPAATDRFAVIRYPAHTGVFSTIIGPFRADYEDPNLDLGLDTEAPRITGFTPGSGLPGATVAISGVNLTGATVLFNTTHAVVNTSLSTATRLVVTVPPGATTGPLKITTSSGVAITPGSFTVLALTRSLISGTVTRPATATAPAAPLPNIPVFLVNATNLPALAVVTANPALLAGSSALVTRTVTNTAGAYSFSALPGAYVVVPVAPGGYFNPLLRTVPVANAPVPNQNFAFAGIDQVPPVAAITTATPTSVTGAATDAGATASGIFTVLVTLQNSHGQFLNWTAVTPTFTALPVIGSFKLANAPSGVAPITNVSRVAAQNWAVLLPAVLPAGTYTVTVRAVDRAFKVSAPVSRVIVKPVTAHATADLSTAVASAAGSCVSLRFAGALDAASAADPGHYQVTINGRNTSVDSAAYSALTHSVSLALAAGALRTGDRVVVTWDSVLDGSGQVCAGQSTLASGP